MKKAMVYLLALTLAFSTMLAGCGEMRGTDGNTAKPTEPPQATVVPETMMPNPEDGVVRDRDGIITDRDTDGSRTGTTPLTPENNENSGAGTGSMNGGNSMPNMTASGKR